VVHSLEVVVSGHAVFVQGFIIFVRLLALPNSSRLSSLSPFNFVATTTNELVWMLHHALVRKRHVLGFFFFVGLFTTSSFSTLPVLASSAVVSLFV
jgi:hypothetical protein